MDVMMYVDVLFHISSLCSCLQQITDLQLPNEGKPATAEENLLKLLPTFNGKHYHGNQNNSIQISAKVIRCTSASHQASHFPLKQEVCKCYITENYHAVHMQHLETTNFLILHI
jgi:hypothetical protein